MSHPQQFAFQRYELARDGHRDYYGLTLQEPMGGFQAGSRFEAGSIRPDGAIHVRQGGRIFKLGTFKNKNESYGSSRRYQASSGRYSAGRSSSRSPTRSSYASNYSGSSYSCGGMNARSSSPSGRYSCGAMRCGSMSRY